MAVGGRDGQSTSYTYAPASPPTWGESRKLASANVLEIKLEVLR